MTNSERQLQLAITPGSWLFILALVVRLAYLFQSQDNPFLYAPILDAQYYSEYAANLADGNWFGDPVPYFMDPLYAYFLALVYALASENLFLVFLLQILFDSVTCALIYSIAVRLWSTRPAVLAALMYALYPVAWFYTLTLLKPTLATFFLTFFIWSTLRALSKQTFSAWFVAGVVAGLGLYTRANFLLNPILASAILLLLYRRTPRLWFNASAALFAGLLLLVSIVGLRNWLVADQWLVMTQNAGYTMYGANYPGNPDCGFHRPDFVQSNNPAYMSHSYKAEAERRLQRTLTATEAGTYWRRQSLDYLLSSPETLISVALCKLEQTLTHDEIESNYSFRLIAQEVPILRFWPWPFSCIFALGAVGLIIAVRHKTETLFLLAPITMVLVTVLLFYSNSRLRFPMTPSLILGAGYCLDYLYRCRHRLADFSIPILAVSIIFALSLSLDGPRMDKTIYALHKADIYSRYNQFDRVMATLDELGPERENYAKVHELRGLALIHQEQWHASIQHLSNALALNQHNEQVWNNLGLAHFNLGAYSLAVDAYSQALTFGDDAMYHHFLGLSYLALGQHKQARRHLQTTLRNADPNAWFYRRTQQALKQILE